MGIVFKRMPAARNFTVHQKQKVRQGRPSGGAACKAGFRRSACLIGVLVLVLPLLSASDDPTLTDIQAAFQRLRERLTDCSVLQTTKTRIERGSGGQTLEQTARIYLGKPGQKKTQVLHTSRNGLPLPGEAAGGRRPGLFGRFGRGAANLDVFTLLLDEGLLRQPEIKGEATWRGQTLLKLSLHPKVSGLQIESGSLWVDPASGQPVALELNFNMGFFFVGARLQLTFQIDRGAGIPVPFQETITFERDTARGRGLSLSIQNQWSDFRWHQRYSEAFFSGKTNPSRGSAAGAGDDSSPRAGASAQEDPFQEIELTPQGSRAGGSGRPTVSSQERRTQEDLVVIQGGSVAAGSGGRSDDVMGRILGGGFLGGRGRGGRGGRRGGRFGRVGFSRANRLQGSVQFSVRSSALDARPYSLTGQETPEPEYLQLSAGLSLGGPLPFLGGDGSTPFQPFFFLNYSGERGQQLESAFASVPTDLERAGNFSQTRYSSGPLTGQPVRIYDPATGNPFPGAIIPEQRLNPISGALLAFFPEPNRADPFLNFFNQQSVGNHRDNVSLRLALPLSERQRLIGVYSATRSASDSFSVFPGLGSRRNGLGQNLFLTANQTLRAGFINNLRFRWNRNRNESLNPFAFNQNISGDLGIENTSPAPIDFGLPTLRFTNYTTLNDGNSSQNVREVPTLGDSLLLVLGRHFLRIGADFSWVRINRIGNPSGSGDLTFAGTATSLISVGGRPVPGSGYDLADFLLGAVQSSTVRFGNSDHYLRGRQFSLYLNDNWRISSRVTLQWGLRYEYTSPLWEKYGRMANLDVGPGFADVSPVLPDQQGPYSGTFPKSLIRSDRNNLAPRLGLAVRLHSGRHATVLRAGYGVFFPDEAYSDIAQQLIAQPPFGFTTQEIAQNGEFFDLATAFASENGQGITNTFSVDPDLRLPTVQNWNISLQQSLPLRLFLSIGYAGSRGIGLELLRAPNRFGPEGLKIEDAAPFLYLSSGAGSTFHGLQILLSRRLRSGLSISGRYEFGKSLDNASSIAGSALIVAQNDSDLRAERGRSSFDQRHRLGLGWVWELPFGNRHRWFRKEGWLNRIFSDWYATGQLNAGSGLPFTARVLGSQINNSGSGSFSSERADSTGISPELSGSQPSTARFFNTAAFTLPRPGFFGNAGRNTITGPGQWNLDLSIYRSILLSREGMRLVLSAQVQNLLNHVNYTSINTVVNSRGFGLVTGAGPMRSLQLTARFLF